ncbi:odorant receptor 13a-like [Ceratina calcarata]|uniref:Odorant receptor 13a-like n=1 Tax=Ceratina calcarata TaxID=156304 RepID=A0AAJ7WCB0_9HYME|nr:odorant receptor 13a-like [Ceratina calcarata]
MLKYGLYAIRSREYKMFLGCIRRDFSAKRPQAEFDILEKYAGRGVFYTQFYLFNCYCCYALFIQTPLTPRILDIFMPKNESRKLGYVYPAYFPIDEEKYYIPITVHMILVIAMVFYVYVACDTSFAFFVQHGCGLLAVAGHRFKAAVAEPESFYEKEYLHDRQYKKIRFAIQGHQYALAYLHAIQEAHVEYLFILIGFVMMTFSVTLVKISNMEVSPEFFKDCTFLLIQLMHIFYMSMQGQCVVDSVNEFSDTIYNAEWYESDKKVQSLLVLAIRSCLNPPKLTAGGLIVLNLQSFSEILKASVSYFTVLQTT